MKVSLAGALFRARSVLLHVAGFTCATVAASIVASWAGWATGALSCFLMAHLSGEKR